MTVQGIGNAPQTNPPPVDEARVEILFELTQGTDIAAEYRAIYELCRMGDVINPIVQRCWSQWMDRQWAASERLEQIHFNSVALTKLDICWSASTPETLKLIEDLRAQDLATRENAARELSAIEDANELLATEAAGNPDWRIRTVAAWALGFTGSIDRYTVIPLYAALHDDNVFVRFVAMWALGHGGIEQIQTLGKLLKYEDDDAAVKGLLVMSLSMYGGPGIAQIIEAFKEENPIT